MDGLLLKLLHDQLGQPEPTLWKVFGSIRQDLDRLFWCFAAQPWMAAPDDFDEDQFLESFEEKGTTSIQLWRPGTLARYADQFAEEHIQLWGIEPTQDDPWQLAARYSASGWDAEVVEKCASVWLIYTDSTCWEIFARKKSDLARAGETLKGKPWVEVYESDSEQRCRTFGIAGLSDVWQYLQ
jgi:hypothetical protein